jgi:hypothetical protein
VKRTHLDYAMGGHIAAVLHISNFLTTQLVLIRASPAFGEKGKFLVSSGDDESMKLRIGPTDSNNLIVCVSFKKT